VRWALPVACLVAAAFAVSATGAPAPTQTDRLHGIRFDLSGAVLTVTLVKGSQDTQAKVWGEQIEAICSPRFGSGTPPRGSVRATQLWPAGQTRLTYRFERDISDRVKWCLLEDGGEDVAAATFAVFFRVYGASAKDRRIGQELRRYLWRNAGARPWMTRVRAIVVDRGRIAVATRLRRNPFGKRSAREICRLIQGADVADFTPGHAVLGHGDRELRACRSRPRPA
jgi:hypothetical protein